MYSIGKKTPTMKKGNYLENFCISGKFSVIYISKERTKLYYI